MYVNQSNSWTEIPMLTPTQADQEYVARSGGTMTGPLNTNGNEIYGLPTIPTNETGAVSKEYSDYNFGRAYDADVYTGGPTAQLPTQIMPNGNNAIWVDYMAKSYNGRMYMCTLHIVMNDAGDIAFTKFGEVSLGAGVDIDLQVISQAGGVQITAEHFDTTNYDDYEAKIRVRGMSPYIDFPTP